MNSLSFVLKKSGHDIYQNIVEVLILSLMGAVPSLIAILFLPVLPGAILVIFTAVPGIAGVAYAMDYKIKGKPFKYTLFFRGFKKYYFRALVLGLLTALLILIPVSSFWYYTNMKTTLNFIIAMFQAYLCLTAFIGLTYTLPLIICGGNKLSYSIKMSFRLFMDNAVYTFGSFIQVAAVSALLIVTVISVPMLFGGMFSVFVINLYENLLLKYEEQSHEKEGIC